MAGARLDRQLAADQQGALAHAGDPEAALGLVEGEAAAVVGDLQLDDSARVASQPHLDPSGAAVAGGVGERLLGDPVDDQLGVVAELGEVAVGRELGLDLAPAPSCSTWPAIAAARPRSSSAVGRSWRASESSSRIAWLASALVSASSASSSGGAASRLPRAAAAARSATG